MAIRLAGGKSYYVQAVGAQSGGGDGLSVGVQMPNGVMIRPITRHFLARAPLGKKYHLLFCIIVLCININNIMHVINNNTIS